MEVRVLSSAQNPAPEHFGPGFSFFETLIYKKTIHPIPVRSKEPGKHKRKAHLSLSPNQIYTRMSNMRNHVQLIGHLGADPEIKEFNEGRKLAPISMATNESYRKQSGERVNDT